MTTNFQTWRAISGGTLYFVDVHPRGALLVHTKLKGISHNLDPVFAVDECIRAAGLPPATEILSPGEPTKAEAIATERERCARVCEEVMEAWQEDCRRMAEGAEACANAVRVDPVKRAKRKRSTSAR